VQPVCGLRDGHPGRWWREREKAELRRSYRTDTARDGAVTVSGAFFDLLCETCARWLNHLEHLGEQDERDEEVAPREHTRELPAWIARLPASVDFDGKVGRDAAARVAAAVLGVGVRSVYRGVKPR